MSVITISRQMGSSGDAIARQVAERLGWQCTCQNLINEAARTARVPQVALAEIEQLSVNLEMVETNFVMVHLKTMNSLEYLQKLKEKRVLALPLSNSCVRIVTHHDIDDEDIQRAIRANREIFA